MKKKTVKLIAVILFLLIFAFGISSCRYTSSKVITYDTESAESESSDPVTFQKSEETQALSSEISESSRETGKSGTEKSDKAKTTLPYKKSAVPKYSGDTVTYAEESKGMSLSVAVPKEVVYGEQFVCEAKITNNTDGTIKYTIPVYDENAHMQIRVSIGTENYKFIDSDTFGRLCPQAVMGLELKPGESYTEKINFLPVFYDGGQENIKGMESVNFPVGLYNGTAAFYYTAEKYETLTLNFYVRIVSGEKENPYPEQTKTYINEGTSICLTYGLPEYGAGELKYVEKASGKKHYFNSDEACIFVRYLNAYPQICEEVFDSDGNGNFINYDYAIHLKNKTVYYNASTGKIGETSTAALKGDDKDNLNSILKEYDYY